SWYPLNGIFDPQLENRWGALKGNVALLYLNVLGVSAVSKTQYLVFLNEMAALSQLPWSESKDQWEVWEAYPESIQDDYALYSDIFHETVVKMRTAFQRHDAVAQSARLACAVELYHHAHDDLPDTL